MSRNSKMATLTLEEYTHMEQLSSALYKAVKKSINTNVERVIFFINYILSPSAIEYYRRININIRLMPYTYKQGNSSITIWKQAIVMD